MNELVYYNAARTALQQAASVDEVKNVKDKAEALRLYAQQQKDGDLERYATEIKIRAMRRIGELSAELDKAQTGGAGGGATVPAMGQSKRDALQDAGISKSSAYRYERLAEVPEKDFEESITKGRNATDILRKVMQESNREERIEEIIKHTGTPEFPKGKYAVIYADPPWRYEHVKTDNRAIENQYPTMELADICALPVQSICNDDSILFLWATAPKLQEAMQVIDSWGFTYRTCAVWDKEKIGMGYYFRVQHELLLVATKGAIPTPHESNRVSSVIREARNEHSEKPKRFYDIISKMYPEFNKIELFCREAHEGFAAWGNQV